MPGSSAAGVVVVGASIAGLRACEALRTDGYAGTVTLIGAEPHLPYDRPPLSKKLLAGDWEADRIALRKPDEYATIGARRAPRRASVRARHRSSAPSSSPTDRPCRTATA